MASLALLTSCTSSTQQIKTVKIEPPAKLMECKDKPEKLSDDAMSRDLQIFTTKLFFAWKDCYDKNQAIRRFVKGDD
jgi:hypothetical protein